VLTWFNHPCLRRLVALIDPENARSVRVAEKTGLRHEKNTLFRGKQVQVYAGGPVAGFGRLGR
jgi:RimJ/RimL family protein N-acetyltransferase